MSRHAFGVIKAEAWVGRHVDIRLDLQSTLQSSERGHWRQRNAESVCFCYVINTGNPGVSVREW